MLDIAFFATFLTTLALFVWTMSRLRNRHSQLFESSGLARAMKTESMKNGMVWLRFLYGSTWKLLDDPLLVRALCILQVLFVVSMGLLILSLAFGFLNAAAHT